MSQKMLFGVDAIEEMIANLSASGSLSDHDSTCLKRLFEDYATEPRVLDVSLEHFSGEHPKSVKWPAAGFASGNVAVSLHIGDAPYNPVLTTMWEIVEKGPIEKRYFISPNAARGMIRRADKMGRHLFGPLRIALEKLAAEDDTIADSSS